MIRTAPINYDGRSRVVFHNRCKMKEGVTKILQTSHGLIIAPLERLYHRSIKGLSSPKGSWSPAAKQLHLGCGTNLLPGWVNVDFNALDGVIQHDLTQPFPLASEVIEFIYSEHFIEHITRAQALALLGECRRVLRTDGVIRLSTPNLKKLVDEYLACRISEWTDVDWRPSTPCQMVNEGLRLWGHQFVYDTEELMLLLNEAGFQQVTAVAWRESRYLELKGLECRPFHGEIIVEAVKRP